MATFTSPPAGVIRRAGPTNPISAILQSIVGIFIGILLILLLAPPLLWFAESQDSAKIFSFSKEVLPTSGAKGFIRTMDIAAADSPLPCYQNKVEGNCLYYNYRQEELQFTAKDHCGQLSENQKVIEVRGQECHRDSNDEEVCEQCYIVNESNWKTTVSERRFQPFTIGSFKVSDPDSAKVLGAEQYTNQIDETHREEMAYYKDSTRLLVAGSSDGMTISHGGNSKYLLVSSMDYQATYDTLKANDVMIGWILRIAAFVVLLIGYSMIFGPISVMSNYVRKIPMIGRFIDNAVGGVIFLVSMLLAIVHFTVLWMLIMIVKNIVVIAVLVLVIGLVFYFFTRNRKPELKPA
jgi:hypothetical protein